MALSARSADGSRVRRWSRETIIEKILAWEARYGEPPCSADWNPSLARWRAQEWRAERYRDGDWPSTNAAKRPFGGSFDAAIRAAGLQPHRPGPRRRGPGVAQPAVAQREPAPVPPDVSADGGLAARAAAAEALAVRLERRLLALERRAEKAEAAVGEARRRARRAAERESRARRARERVLVASRTARDVESGQLEAAAADAEARLRASADQAEAAGRDAATARLAQRAAELRAADAEARAETAERLGAAARAELASEGTGAAWRAAHAAEARADEAERRARELATLVCGEPRRLAPDELAELRRRGPSGPVVLAAALRTLAQARAAGSGPALEAALTALASAAVRWRDRL